MTALSIFDGLANMLTRLGTAADRNTQSQYYVPIITQQQVEAAYRSSWLTRKIHDLVPFEMTRAGRTWQADKEQIERLENTEKRLRLWPKLRGALTAARLHGGAAVIIGVRGQGDTSVPLDVSKVTRDSLRYLITVSRHQLNAPFGMDRDPESDFFGTPAMWEMQGAKGGRLRVHPSRVLTFHGSPLPAGMMQASTLDQFWGDPLLVSIKSAIDNSETSQAAVATLLHEMKQDVISIPGLTTAIQTAADGAAIEARVRALNMLKGMFGVLLLDGGDPADGKGKEEWTTRELSFAQHPELLRQFLSIVAGAADIPVTRLMGESPGGLNSTGKGEERDFNRMIGARQEADLNEPLLRLDEILLRSALGARPPEIGYLFAPLEQPSRRELAEVDKLEAETVEIYQRTALVPTEAMAETVRNRMIESGRWPGLDQALDDLPDDVDLPEPPTAANENTVIEMERRGAVTRDQAMLLLTDARPRSLYVQRKLVNAAEFIAWAKGQGFDTTTPAEDLHVTIMFSRRPVDWMQAGSDDWGQEGDLRVAEGGARIVEPLGDKGAVVLLFNSPRLSYRHEAIKRDSGASFDYSEYQPHVTITYRRPEGLDLRTVEPYRGPLVFGPEIFEEITEDWQDTIKER